MRYKRFLMTMLTLCVAGISYAGLTFLENGIGVSTPYEAQQSSTTRIGIPGDRDVVIEGDLQVVEKVDMREIVTMTDNWVNLPAKDTDSVKAVTLSTPTLASNAKKYTRGDFTLSWNSAAVPRDIACRFACEVDSVVFYGTTALEGVNSRGELVSEVVVTTMGAANLSNYAYYGLYGATLTITYGSQIQYVEYDIGTGDKIGLKGDIDEASDIRVCVNGLMEDDAVTVDLTYDTWTHSDVPDAADDYAVTYHINTNVRQSKGTYNYPY